MFLSFLIYRHVLASLHFNENLRRDRRQTKDGKTYMHVTFPKFKMGEEVVREIAEPPSYGMTKCLYLLLVYTTQVNSTFCTCRLASSEVISQVLFTSTQPNKNKLAFVGILSQRKLLFGPLVIQLVWYILKQLFTSVSVKVVDIYLHYGE